jgi:hypothetical protein
MAELKRWVALGAEMSVALFLIPGASQPARAQSLRGPHPYLMYTQDDITRYKIRLSASAEDKAAFETLAKEAENVHVPQTEGAMEIACLALRVTGRPEFEGYIKAGLEKFDEKPNFSDSALLARNPPWHAGLGTAALVAAYGLGFDCIHEELSPVERKHFADALVTKGLHPILDDWLLGPTRIHAMDTMGHNWWSALIFSAGIGAMAIIEERPDVLPWLQHISEASKEWYSYTGSDLETKPRTFDRAGGFYESLGYAEFAESEYLRFAFAWHRAFRSPDLPRPRSLANWGEFFVYGSYPASERVFPTFFGDGNFHTTGYGPITFLWALGERRADFLWYLHQFDLIPQTQRPRQTAFELVYGPSASERAQAPALPGLSDSMLYPDIGWAMMRSSWQKDSDLFAIKSGMTWNHAHADAGSFLLFHHGDALLVNSGGSPSYSIPEYDGYYRQSRAHNVVLFNGEAEYPDDTYYGSQFPGSLSHQIDAGNLKYIMADNTGPTMWKFRRNFRHVLWIGGVILIIDDVKSYEPGTFQWVLHVGGKAAVKGADLDVTGPHGEVLVHPLFPEELPPGLPADFPEAMRIVEKQGLRDHDIKDVDTYYSFEPSGKTDQTTFVMAIVLKEPDRPEPTLERFQEPNVDGVRITQNGIVSEIYVNTLAEGRIRHRNANIIAEGWETDAYLTALTFPENADRSKAQNLTDLFVADGSYLRRNGSVIYDSLSKVFMNATYSRGKLDLLLQGQPDINLSLFSSGDTHDLILNGKPEKVAVDAASGLLRISHFWRESR